MDNLKEIKPIIDRMKQHHPDCSVEPIEQAFSFVCEKSKTFPPTINKQLCTRTFKIAHNQSIRPISPDLLAVFIIDTLIQENEELLTEVRKNFPRKIYLMSRALWLTRTHLNTSFYKHDALEHTINTTMILGELRLGYKTICASLLKHLPNCTDIKYPQIKKEFGQEIHDIIEQTNKLRNLKQVANQRNKRALRHMFLAMSQEIRAIILRMSSVIDWLKNIEKVPESHREKIAIEAMQIYAPLADMLGMWNLKWQLEDYAFKYLNPTEYKKIERRFNIDEKKNREKYIEKTKRVLARELKKAGINAQIHGRLKNFYSIYQKMQNKRKAFNEIYDVFALTVVVDSIDDCYRTMGIIHSLWKPKARRVKDYIAAPKSNNYRSVHTTVIGFNARMTEFQIRTKKMHQEAIYGVAAHWFYKNKNRVEQPPIWIKDLLREHMDAKSDQEFIENVDIKTLMDSVFVYTPKGDVISLPVGSTPVDFAYHIHTAIGHKCKTAIINGKTQPLHYELQNEDTVEIIVDNKQTLPNPDWLSFICTPLAKKAIKAALD